MKEQCTISYEDILHLSENQLWRLQDECSACLLENTHDCVLDEPEVTDMSPTFVKGFSKAVRKENWSVQRRKNYYTKQRKI